MGWIAFLVLGMSLCFVGFVYSGFFKRILDIFLIRLFSVSFWFGGMDVSVILGLSCFLVGVARFAVMFSWGVFFVDANLVGSLFGVLVG